MKFVKYSLLALLPTASAFGGIITSFDTTGYLSNTEWTLSEDPLAFSTNIPSIAAYDTTASSGNEGNAGVISFHEIVPSTPRYTAAISTSTQLNDLDYYTTNDSQFQQLSFNVALSLDFPTPGSSDPTNYTARNAFGFTLADNSNSNLLTVTFSPDTFESADVWRISYQFEGSALIVTDKYLQDNGYTDIAVTFFSDGISLDIGGAHFSGAPSTYAPGSDIGGDLTFFADENAGELGDNGMIIDNIQVTAVPEPSIAALAGLASLGFLRRRRA